MDGRAVLLTADDRGIGVYQDWDGLRAWADASPDGAQVQFTREQLRSPSPTPRQIVAIGLNYDQHAAESGFEAPEGLPPTFTKLVSSLTGPDAEVVIPSGGR